MSRPFEARYGGGCTAECGEPISAGQMIAWTDDGVMHEDCAESYKPERPVRVCQGCWLTKPCDCEED